MKIPLLFHGLLVLAASLNVMVVMWIVANGISTSSSNKQPRSNQFLKKTSPSLQPSHIINSPPFHHLSSQHASSLSPLYNQSIAHSSKLNAPSLSASMPHHIKPKQSSGSSPLCHVSKNKNVTKLLEGFAKRVKSIIPPPQEFSSNYLSHCWKAYFDFSPEVLNRFRKSSKHQLSDNEASQLMTMVLNMDAGPSFVCIPNVYFMGFPRSGSTQLYKTLMRHPQLRGGFVKESHWWTKSMERFQNFPHDILGIIRYISTFQQSFGDIKNNPDTLLIDGSQSTIWDTRRLGDLCFLPKLFSEVVPGSKYIVLMRDPVQRMYSDFKYLCEEQWKKQGIVDVPQDFILFGSEQFHEKATDEVKKFEDCVLNGTSLEECTHYRLSGAGDSLCGHVRIGVSLYHVHIRRWLREIPREQFLFLKTDELASSPLQLLRKVWLFLGVREQSEEDISDILHEHLHSSHAGDHSSSGAMKSETQAMLQRFFQPHNNALAELLNDNRYKWDYQVQV